MRYTREDYEHRNCLAVTRTESGEFVKCLTHTGNADDISQEHVLGPAASRLDNKIDKREDHSVYTDGEVLKDAIRKHTTAVEDSAREHTQPSKNAYKGVL